MNSCFVSFTFLCFQSVLRLYCIFLYLFRLFWRANQMTKNRRRLFEHCLNNFVSLVGHFRYFMGLSCKVECFHGERRPSGLTKQPAERRQVTKWLTKVDRGALFFSLSVVLGTNTRFVYFFLLPFFSIEISTENNRHRSLNFSVFYIW